MTDVAYHVFDLMVQQPERRWKMEHVRNALERGGISVGRIEATRALNELKDRNLIQFTPISHGQTGWWSLCDAKHTP
jgi:hypothetical protein